jgi:hypothetical protein
MKTVIRTRLLLRVLCWAHGGQAGRRAGGRAGSIFPFRWFVGKEEEGNKKKGCYLFPGIQEVSIIIEGNRSAGVVRRTIDTTASAANLCSASPDGKQEDYWPHVRLARQLLLLLLVACRPSARVISHNSPLLLSSSVVARRCSSHHHPHSCLLPLSSRKADDVIDPTSVASSTPSPLKSSSSNGDVVMLIRGRQGTVYSWKASRLHAAAKPPVGQTALQRACSDALATTAT